MRRYPYRLFGAFNGCVLSQHRTAYAAGRAARAIDAALTGGSYLPMVLLRREPKSRRGICPAYTAVPTDGSDTDDDEFVKGRQS